MSMPERNGDWMLRTSAEDDAPQRHGIEKGVELVRRVEPSRVGQSDLLDQPGTGLQLPNNLDLFTEPVVFHGCQRDEGLRVGDPLKTAGRQRAGNNLVDDPVPGSNADQLPLLWGVGECRRHAVVPRRIRSRLHEALLALNVYFI